ncbi:hypothetical protein GR157_28685 [Burkholderia sp. 4701]|nr:hypothetical protein [Burkholderia sp. 4701]MXN85798.1 hypothetical protein [Burkholderia sp. 4812]
MWTTILIGVAGTVILLAIASARLARRYGKGMPGPAAARRRIGDVPRRAHERATERARFAALDARGADACATALERLAESGAHRASADFPSIRSRKQQIRERARKAREHATRAHDHAHAARSALGGHAPGRAESQLDEVRRHAHLANEAHLHARDLLEFTLAAEKRRPVLSRREGDQDPD